MAEEFYRQVDPDSGTFESIGDLITRYEDGASAKTSLVAAYHDLAASGAFALFMRAVLRKIRDDHAFTPSWMTPQECALVANRRCTLSIRRVERNQGNDFIYAASGSIILTLMSARPVRIALYRANGPTEPLEWVRDQELACDDSIEIDAPYAFRFHLNDQSALFSRMLLDSADYTAVYDANSLAYISMVSLVSNHSRWFFMAKIAGQLESAQAVPLLEQLTAHPNYNVRWTALQELFGHDTERAIATLDRFKDDDSEFIREQALAESDRIRALLAEEEGLAWRS